MNDKIEGLNNRLKGEIFSSEVMRRLYATDASAYREMPLAVAFPKNEEDIQTLVAFAREEKTSLIPRTAGTSLAGQVVGKGIIVDVSKYLDQVLEVNQKEHWIKVQPGIVRDDLNKYLQPYNLFFAPETATANRAMIGGMVGNNSCGANSIVYGSTRNHVISLRAVLSDGSVAEFGPTPLAEFNEKCDQPDGLERKLYASIQEILSKKTNQESIKEQFPKESITRRNTGYALDLLLKSEPFADSSQPFNFCQLLAGSEGTLAFVTEIKLNLVDPPSGISGLLCAHFESVKQSMQATLIAMKHKPNACELIDRYILECTKENIKQRQNRFFIKGDPGAILVIEVNGQSLQEVEQKADIITNELQAQGLGYHFPLLTGDKLSSVWELRKAGLGLLSNIPGDAKPAPVVEDTAVALQDLPEYIEEFNQILKKHQLHCVHYAHAGDGEIHLRPILNLKTSQGNSMFRTIAQEIATLVKKYGGSLSGEHGDGRLRGEFVEFMVGDNNYKLMREVKNTWDPDHIFNPNKIIDTPSMNSSLRYVPDVPSPTFNTIFNFGDLDILQSAEKCNGSGDCRKTHLSGGTMCPSYMATRSEKDTTRARANILREFLTTSDKSNRFDHSEIMEVMDLCLSCKGCKAECPSNVDMTKMKGEFLQQYYDANGVPFRTKLVGNFSRLNRLGSTTPWLFNALASNRLSGSILKKIAGFAQQRTFPVIQPQSLPQWFAANGERMRARALELDSRAKTVLLFCDEFTSHNDTDIGIKTVKLLSGLGYQVELANNVESGRTYLSKGLIRKAKSLASENVKRLVGRVTESTPLVGIEPSALLTLRDEYLDLLDGKELSEARELAASSFLIDEFIAREIDAGRVKTSQFHAAPKSIKLHGHCHQKALASQVPTKKMLSLPENYKVEIIPSGCCGMAGSFGYEKEHYQISMDIGELVLFPIIRESDESVVLAAPGTSCRHQIMDGTGRRAVHPVEILYEALV